ncbi:MAG: cysteine--tRNA ligase [Gammaproteobacteria bacterium]|nr:cysteine--tRNA ligase [Gammaproteobacteria bacterium]
MQIKLHNTQSGRREVFRPQDPQRVTLYVCGPTVYGPVHIGNGRPAVVFDVLRRLLKTVYPEVVYVSNITDVDDKINAQALANGEPIQALADRFSAAYNDDIKALGVLPADVQPRATGHIAEIIAMIETLIGQGFAYEASGHVLFHVPADPHYGCLSHRSLEDMLDGARVEVAPYKRDPKDFVLWKPSASELPGWESPWGRGRPGWHIECSAMIQTHLGTRIDIHGGGADLAFPHHENELAQSRCAHGQHDCVGYWLHNGMLTLGQEKMSKSLGNIVTIADLRQRHDGETLRYALLSGQYRSPLVWSDELLDQSRRSLDRLYGALRGGESPEEFGAPTGPGAEEFPEEVLTALADDLNTPGALAALHGIAGALNRTGDAAEAERLRLKLKAGGWLLGLLGKSAEVYFQGGAAVPAPIDAAVAFRGELVGALDAEGAAAGAESSAHLAVEPHSPQDIEARIAERNQARKDRDFNRADAIRDQLAEAGIELEDTRTGTRWKRAR